MANILPKRPSRLKKWWKVRLVFLPRPWQTKTNFALKLVLQPLWGCGVQMSVLGQIFSERFKTSQMHGRHVTDLKVIFKWSGDWLKYSKQSQIIIVVTLTIVSSIEVLRYCRYPEGNLWGFPKTTEYFSCGASWRINVQETFFGKHCYHK